MVIEKIVRLQGIGILHEPLPRGAQALEKTVAIYSDNGRGKSTLCSVLRSLCSAEPDELRARETIAGSRDPLAELLIGSRLYSITGSGCSDAAEDIVVFDNHFVDGSVFAGNHIEASQRQGLLEFALGLENARMARRIADVKNTIKQLDNDIRPARTLLMQQAKPLGLEEFLGLPEEAPSPEALLQAEERWTASKDAASISARRSPLSLALPSTDIGSVETLLAESLDSLGIEAEAAVHEHIREHLDEKGEDWLRQGSEYARGDRCPYCNQSTVDVALVAAYRSYFDAAYRELCGRIETARRSVNEELSDATIEASTAVATTNAEIALEWADWKMPSFPAAPEGLGAALRDLRTAIMEIFAAKAAAPLARLAPGEAVDGATRMVDTLAAEVAAYNRRVVEIARLIDEVKLDVGSANAADLGQRYERLLAQQRRAGSAELCDQVLSARKQRADLEAEKQGLREELRTSSETLIGKYGEAVNERLNEMGADFSIVGFARSDAGDGTPRAAYALQLRGARVPLDRGDAGPHFGTTLSEGDKRLLAFAFFLARLDLDDELKERIVVLDDPVCSFDPIREDRVAGIVMALTERAGQVIVLSHNPDFVRVLRERGFGQILQIRPRGANCVIDDCDIDAICESMYARRYRTLLAYRDEGARTEQLSVVAEAIRPYLEENLRHRFPLELGSSERFGDMIARIRNAPEGTPLEVIKDEIGDLEKLNEFGASAHHADPWSGRLDQRELDDMVRLALGIGWN